MLARAQCTAAPPAAALARPPLGRLQAPQWILQRRRSLTVRAATAGSSGGGGSEHRSRLSEAQLQAAAERLMRISRAELTNPEYSSHTDESMRQRMLLLLRLGFSQAAIELAVHRKGRGPYIAEEHISETVALLRRWGFSQQQLDSLLAGSSTFTRAPADIEAVLAWLQRKFGLQQRQAVQVSMRTRTLLQHKQATLEARWRAFVKEFPPTAENLHKVAQLQELFGLDSSNTPRYIGHLAGFFRFDIEQTAKPHFQFLQQLTGLSPADLAMPVLHNPALLRLAPDTLQRKYAAMEAALGPEGARQVVRACPDALMGVEGRAALNISSLHQLFGDPGVDILLLNPRLAKLDMQSDTGAARMRARVAFRQQAYGLSAAEAATACAEMLHRSLCTVGPRVACYQQQRPGQPLPPCSAFTASDERFCNRLKLDPFEFEAFKEQWLASEEGRAVCAHEGKQLERQPAS